MKFAATTLSILLICAFAACNHQHEEAEVKGPEYEKRLKKAEMQVDEIMEMMDLPEYGLVKLSKEGQFLSKDYMQAAEDMIKHGRRMKDVDYPDKKFMKLTDKMLEAFDVFEAALKTKNVDDIKKGWEAVALSCKKCHDVYD